MTRYIKQSILVLLICLCQTVWAQIYPVQAVSTVYSPYSSKISDYSNPLVNRINLQLITTDLAVQNRQVQLFLKIQGNGITAQSAAVLSGTLPIYINGGEITNLTSNELSSYFRFQNLQGLSTTQYSEPLPDGVYTICFQVYDLVTRKWLSQNSCATMYLMLNDPPQLNLPANNEQIASTTFPNINFSWTPRHLNATNVSYTFEIKEILNPTLDPAFAFETSNLLYKEEDLRTTNLLYDLSKPTLIPGKKYAWRVKAISTNGLAENNVFKNNGYSQINYFTYASTCEAPRYLLSEQQGSNRVKIMWDGINTQQRYHIQYKKANTPNAEWFDTYTVNTQTLLTNLEPGYTYEFRVGATCEPTQYGITQSYTYSGIQTFAINKNDKATTYNCGIVPTIEIRNQQPLGAMVTNETFMAGDFPVKVLDVQGGNGMFSGSGYIQVPYLADTRIGVTFNNIRINADYQMLDGVVETTYDPNWGNVDFIDDLWDVNQQDIVVNFPIESIGFENGEIIVTGPNGQTETFPGGKDTIITGSDNKNYYVDANGTVTGPFDTAKGGKPTPENTDGVNKNGQAIAYTAEGIRVVFEKNSDTQFAFDQVAYNKELTSDYKKIGDTFVPFKAVPNGLTDKLLAKVTITDSKINVDSLFFKTQNGVEIKADKVGNDFVLNLKGAQKFAIEEVQATIKQGDKYKIAGVFNLVHVSPKSVSLKLVPTEGVSISDKQIDEIKAIYNQLAISVDIEVVPEFNISNYLVEGVLPTEDAFGDLSTYSPAQNAIINDFTKERNPELAYYIFVTNKTSNTGQGGYMRLNNQFGFVFNYKANEEPDEKTKVTATSLASAHELGHGAFRLEHPFKQYKNKGLAKKDTPALMDYAKGTELLFTDWKQINDPVFKLYAFQSQSDGEFSDIRLTPDWLPFTYSSTSEHGLSTPCFNNGGICSIVENNVTYYYHKVYIINNKDEGPGYFNKSGKKLEIKTNLENVKDVIVVDYKGGNCGKLYDVKYSELLKLKQFINSDIDFSNSIFLNPRDIISCEGNYNNEYKQLINKRQDLNNQQKKRLIDVLSNLSQIPYDLIKGKCTDTEKQNCNCIDLTDNNQTITNDCFERLIISLQNSNCTDEFIRSFEERMDITTFIEAAQIVELLNEVDDCIINRIASRTRYKLYELMFKNSIVAHPYGNYSLGFVNTKINDSEDYLIVKLLESANNEEQAWFLNTFLNKKDNAGLTNLNKLITENPNLTLTGEILNSLNKIVQTNNSVYIAPTINENVNALGTQISIPTKANTIMIYYENWVQPSNSFYIKNFRVKMDKSELIVGSDNKINVIQKGGFYRHYSEDKVEINDNYFVNPWDDVIVIFAKDMSETIGLEIGKTIKTKAIYATYLQEIGNRVVKGQNTQIAISAVAIVGSAFTFGTSLELAAASQPIASLASIQLLTSELVLSASIVNLFLLTEADNVNLTPGERESLKIWNQYYDNLLLIDGGINFLSTIRGITKIKNVMELEPLIQKANSNANNIGKIVHLYKNTKNLNFTPKPSGGSYITAENKAINAIKSVDADANAISINKLDDYNDFIYLDGTSAVKIDPMMFSELSPLTVVKNANLPKPNVATQLIEQAENVSINNLTPYKVHEFIGLHGFTELMVATTELSNKAQVIYASPAVATKLEDAKKNNGKCTVYDKFGQPTCYEFRTLLAQTNDKAAVDKLYNNLTIANAGLVVKDVITLSNDAKTFLIDIKDTSATIANKISVFTPETISSWKLLNDNQKTYARKDWTSLVHINKLDRGVQAQILKYSDNSNSKSTLKKFTADLESTSGFSAFLNENPEYAKGFVGHKQQPIYADKDYDVLTEALKDTPIQTEALRNKIGYWIDYADENSNRKKYFELGKQFEKTIEKALKNENSPEYQRLLDLVPDLKQRQIITQVQLCINNSSSCNNKGDYFIADFVLAKTFQNDEGEDVWDIIIADTKLSESTDFTTNQKNAMGVPNYVVKSIKLPPSDILNNKIDIESNITEFKRIVLKNKFLKIYSDGKGNYQNIK